MRRRYNPGVAANGGLLATCSFDFYRASFIFRCLSKCAPLLKYRSLTRGKPPCTRPVFSSKTNNREGEGAGGCDGHPRSEAVATPFPTPSEDASVARSTLLEEKGDPRLSAMGRYTNLKGDDKMEGSPDGVDEIASIDATTSTEISELPAPPMGTETIGVLIDPSEETYAGEILGRPNEAKAAGLQAPSEIHRQSGHVDIQGVVEEPAEGKQELLYAAEIRFRFGSLNNEGRPISALAEVSFHQRARLFDQGHFSSSLRANAFVYSGCSVTSEAACACRAGFRGGNTGATVHATVWRQKSLIDRIYIADDAFNRLPVCPDTFRDGLVWRVVFTSELSAFLRI